MCGSPRTAVASVPDVGKRFNVRKPAARICVISSILRWMSAEASITCLQMTNDVVNLFFQILSNTMA